MLNVCNLVSPWVFINLPRLPFLLYYVLPYRGVCVCVLFIVFLMSLSREKIRKLRLQFIAKQVAGLALAFPTAGMSLVWNLTSIDEYHRKYYEYE